MLIKCWGSRGSIPVSGKQYLEFGGDTTCFEVVAKSGHVVIIDAGTGIRRLGKSIVKRNISECHLLFTHTHWDHILGLAFFKPLLYAKNRLIIQDRKFAGLSTRQVFKKVMKAPLFPIDLSNLSADICFDSSINGSFSIGSLDIETIPTSHSEDSLGYKFKEDGRSFVFLTDNELGYHHPQGQGFDKYVEFAKQADIVFHDAEYTRDEYPYRTGWGHSCVDHVLDLGLKAGVKQLGLIHLNQDRSDSQMNAIVKESVRFLKNKHSTIKCFAVGCDFEIRI